MFVCLSEVFIKIMNEQYHYVHVCMYVCMYVCKMDIYIQSMTFAAALLDLSSSCAAFLFPFLPNGQGLHTATAQHIAWCDTLTYTYCMYVWWGTVWNMRTYTMMSVIVCM